jgi:hypothetical protein
MQEITTASVSKQLIQFCPKTLKYVSAESDLRRQRRGLRFGDDSHRAACFASDILALVRKRHRHISHCPACLVAEALARR